jgi:biopolymer transport protein ExbD
MKINLDSPPEDVQIQIVPLIDVIFCILTFFILAALQLTRQQGINLELPRAETSTVQMRENLVVTIDANGQIYVDKQLVDRAQLYQFIKASHEQDPNRLLVLRAAQTAFYNDVIQVLDIMRAIGGNQVALATDPAPAPTANPTTPQFPGLQSPGLQSPGLTPGLQPTPGLPNSGTVNPNDLQQIPGSGVSPVLPTTQPIPGQQTPPAAGGPLAPNPSSPAPTSVPPQ